MLTITFIAANMKTVVSCDSYDAIPEDEDDGVVRMIVSKGFGAQSQTEVFFVDVNAADGFTVAYVTNLMGKTIDRIGGSAA